MIDLAPVERRSRNHEAEDGTSRPEVTQKATAVRVAKKMGLKEGEYEIKLVGKGQWEIVVRRVEDPTVATVVPAAAVEITPVESGAQAVETTTAPAEDKPKLVVQDYADAKPTEPTQATEPTPSTPAPVATETKPKNKSTVPNPTKAVWTIADEMKAADPNATRKAIVDECIRRGIAVYTAKTQYQRWSKAKKTAPSM